jgi:hypothetical protein
MKRVDASQKMQVTVIKIDLKEIFHSADLESPDEKMQLYN